jgi:hypothetical protein
MTMRGRIRSLTQSAGGNPARRELPVRAVAASHGRQRDQLDQANGPGSDTFEWDMRNSDGPTDRGFYDCACGCQFTAHVATTVSCPNCGAGQAW